MATRIQQRLRDERGTPDREHSRASPSLKAVEAPVEDPTVELARHIYGLRRRRDAAFGAEFFSEPGWDILLYLYAWTGGSGASCVSDACIGAAAPQTTALRRVRELEEAGLIIREGDPADARRSYVRLSSRALRKMRNLLKEGSMRLGLEP